MLLVQAQKLDTLGTLARGVVRDFSSIMTTIAGYTGLCIERTKKEDPPRYFLHKIMDISKDAMNTIRQLNMFGKNATMDFKSLDCNTVITNVLPLLNRSIDDTVLIETDLGPGLRTIWGKEEMVEQIIMNLTLNGVCSMSTGGRLTIKTSNVMIDEDYCKTVSAAATGPSIMISVADTGASISNQQHVFDPCAQIKQAGKGLELPVVCIIVKLHKGWMTAESRRAAGTEIRVFLPAEK